MQSDDINTSESLVVEEGLDPSVLIAVFSGLRGRWGARRFDFVRTTQSLRYSRILCRDPYSAWYHNGIGEEASGIRPLAELLRERIEELAPSVKIFIGNSAGGYAAMLFGHMLEADMVHAFSPQTCLKPNYVKRHRRLDQQWKADAYERLWASPDAAPDLFDLKAVLKRHNGRTTYFVHMCENNDNDRGAADWIAASKGVRICSYPCTSHGVARHMAKEKLLYKMLQPDLEQVSADLSKEADLR
jgi:hypothetical protein